MKKVLVGMFALVMCAGMAMAEDWCAAAICKNCGMYYEHTISNKVKGNAIAEAKSRLRAIHASSGCKRAYIVGWADKGACPSPEAVKKNGE